MLQRFASSMGWNGGPAIPGPSHRGPPPGPVAPSSEPGRPRPRSRRQMHLSNRSCFQPCLSAFVPLLAGRFAARQQQTLDLPHSPSGGSSGQASTASSTNSTPNLGFPDPPATRDPRVSTLICIFVMFLSRAGRSPERPRGALPACTRRLEQPVSRGAIPCGELRSMIKILYMNTDQCATNGTRRSGSFSLGHNPACHSVSGNQPLRRSGHDV